MPTNGGLFSGDGYIFAGKQVVKSGLPLEPVFRVEKRDYVRRVTLTDRQSDAAAVIAEDEPETRCH